MNAETLGGLLTRERRSGRPALEDASGREYDAHWLCTSSWKAGNFLRHSGVRRGVTVGVVGDGPLALLSFFGTGLLEGTTRFDPPQSLTGVDGFRTLVGPAAVVGEYQLPRGAQRVGYGGEPESPDVHHLDAGLWSENPSFPPLSIGPDTPLLSDGERTYTHGAVVEAAHAVVDEWNLEAGSRVVTRAPLSEPGTIAAGVIAPLLADGVIVLPGESTTRAEFAVSSDDGVPESAFMDPEDVEIG